MMEKYSNYRLEDFLSDDAFREWVLSGSPGSEGRWTEIPLRYPDKAGDMERAAAVVREWKKHPSALSDEQMVRDIRRILSHAEIPREEPSLVEKRRPYLVRYAAAAVLVLGIGWLVRERGYLPALSDSGQAHSVTAQNTFEINNSQNTPLGQTLPDGSRVTLSPGSRISYSAAFATEGQRDVTLSGEAFFEVEKDSLRPFFVYAGGITTRVLGTSFTVKSGAKDVSVTVKTGKVAVYLPDESSENMVLTPNQKAVYSSSDGTITRTLAEAPLLVYREELQNRFHFDEVPAATVFQALEKAYGIPIRFDEATMQHCLLTLPFREEPFYQKLDILCRTIRATYRVEGNEILIESDGCE